MFRHMSTITVKTRRVHLELINFEQTRMDVRQNTNLSGTILMHMCYLLVISTSSVPNY